MRRSYLTMKIKISKIKIKGKMLYSELRFVGPMDHIKEGSQTHNIALII